MRLFLSICVACGVAACSSPPPDPAAAPTPVPDFAAKEAAVGSGFRALAWGATSEQVKKEYPDVEPGKKDPSVLVRETTALGKPVTEAFFFGKTGGLEEVEVAYREKLSPHESAALALELDGMFGVHQTSHADDHRYQFAWIGRDTEVRLTYDLRESVTFGPVLSYAVRREAPAPSPTATPGGGTVVKGGSAGSRFAASVRAARKDGLHLVGAEASAGKLSLIYGDASRAVEISLAANPKTGELLGAAELARAPSPGAAVQRSAEAAIDAELASSEPRKLVSGGKPGLDDVLTLELENGRYVQLQPGAPNLLVGASRNKPR